MWSWESCRRGVLLKEFWSSDKLVAPAVLGWDSDSLQRSTSECSLDPYIPVPSARWQLLSLSRFFFLTPCLFCAVLISSTWVNDFLSDALMSFLSLLTLPGLDLPLSSHTTTHTLASNTTPTGKRLSSWISNRRHGGKDAATKVSQTKIAPHSVLKHWDWSFFF